MNHPKEADQLQGQPATGRLLTWLRKPIEQKVFGLGGRLSGLRYNRWVESKKLEFGGVLHPHEMGNVSPDSLKHSTHYLASSEYSLRILLDQAFQEKGAFELFWMWVVARGCPRFLLKNSSLSMSA